MKEGNNKGKANAGNALSAFKLHLSTAGDLSQMTSVQRKAALAKLAHALNASYTGDQELWKKFNHDIVPRLWEKGTILVTIKSVLTGEFELWCEENLDFSLRCAQIYMRLAKEMPENKARDFDGSLRDAKKLLGWLPKPTPKKATKPKSTEANHGSSRTQDETQTEADAQTNHEESSAEADSQAQAETRTAREARHETSQTESDTQTRNGSKAGTETKPPVGLRLLRLEADRLLSNLRAACMTAPASSREERQQLRDLLTHMEGACGHLCQELRSDEADETTGETKTIAAAEQPHGMPTPVVPRGKLVEAKPEETSAESDKAALEPRQQPGGANAPVKSNFRPQPELKPKSAPDRVSAKWQLMNWRLHNRDLAAIWGIKGCTVSQMRWRKKRGSAMHGDPEAYRRELNAEKAKAKSCERAEPT